MAGPTATFTADFTKWNEALASAKLGMKEFELTGKGVQQSLERIGKSFLGVQIKQQADLAALAVQKIGGVAMLTAAEQKKLGLLIDEALAKYKALGEVAPQALIQIRGELDKIEAENKQLAEAAQHLKTLGTNAQGAAAPVAESALSFSKLAGGVLTANAAYDVLRGTGRAVIQFLGDSIQSYASAEAAQKKLTVALQAQGTATPQVIGQYNDLASTFQRTTIYSDDLINEMEALLTQVGGVMPQDMEKALTASTDLASGLGIDLNQATMLVAKAMEGNVGALGRYGISLDESRVKAEGAEYVLAKLGERFGGQAQAQLDTYTGRLANLANAWDNVKEAVGKIIVTNPIVEQALRRSADAASAVSSAADAGTTSWALYYQAAGGGEFGTNVISLLERQAELANEVERAIGRLNALAAKTKLPISESLKPKTEGFEIFEKDVEAHEKAQRAAEAHTEAIRKLREQMSGSALLSDLKNALEAFQGLPRPIQESAIAQEALATAYVRALPAMENASAAMLRQAGIATELAIKWGLLEPPIANAAQVLGGIPTDISNADVAFMSLIGDLDKLMGQSVLTGDALKGLGQNIGNPEVEFIKKTETAVKEMHAGLVARVARVVETMGQAINGSFAQMLLGAKGFKDGFLDIWHSIKAGIGQIFASILQDFTNRFLKGLLNALTGARGGFSSAFSGLFGGGGRIGANIAPSSMFGMGGGMGGGSALAGLAGGVGAGAAGLGLGFLGQNIFGGAGAGAATFGAGSGFATGALIGSIVPGIGTLIGGIIGGLSGVLGGLLGDTKAMKANDNRDAFISQFGGAGTGAGSGFATLAATLTQATGEAGGGRLFQQLIGANDPQKVAAAIAAVTAELERYAQKTAAVAKVEADHATAMESIKSKFGEQIDIVQRGMASLKQQVEALDASEAPEKHMGTVEKRARARIKAEEEILKKQLANIEQEKQKAIEAEQAKYEAAKKTAEQIAALPPPPTPPVTVYHYRWQLDGEGPPVYEAPEPGSGGSNRPPGYAQGGVVRPLYAATGMMVPFLPRGTDTVPAMLTPGEGVITRRAMQSLGADGLAALNRGTGNDESLLPRPSVPYWAEAHESPALPLLQSVTILEVDKREIGRAIADILPGELRRLGIRVRT